MLEIVTNVLASPRLECCMETAIPGEMGKCVHACQKHRKSRMSNAFLFSSISLVSPVFLSQRKSRKAEQKEKREKGDSGKQANFYCGC